MSHKNPFTPTFGMVPPFMAGRDRLLEEMGRAFEDGPGNPNLSSILVGARGTGKTALLSRIADEARSRGWLAINTVAADGMLEDIIQQAGKAAAHLVDHAPTRRLSAVGIGQLLNLEWVFERPDEGNWRTRMEALLEKVESRGSGLLITVDEVRVEIDEMIHLISTYQLLISGGHRVALVMAGLSMEVTDLIDDRRVTFPRRARLRHLGRIGDAEVRQAFARTVRSAEKDIEPQALSEAVAAVDGFAYLMQLVGYFTWMEAEDSQTIALDHAEQGVSAARDDFRRGVLEATYREMSAGDRAFARSMLPDNHGSKLADVARRMGRTTSYASTYKRRLLKQGPAGLNQIASLWVGLVLFSHPIQVARPPWQKSTPTCTGFPSSETKMPATRSRTCRLLRHESAALLTTSM